MGLGGAGRCSVGVARPGRAARPTPAARTPNLPRALHQIPELQYDLPLTSKRVRAALTAMGLGLPPKRVLINLAPADVLKEGSHFDLPIALAVLAAIVPPWEPPKA